VGRWKLQSHAVPPLRTEHEKGGATPLVQLAVIAAVTALSFTFKKRPLNIVDRIALLAFAASIFVGGNEATRQELPLALIVGGVCVLAAWGYDRLQHRPEMNATT
jgi:hypothetical protein